MSTDVAIYKGFRIVETDVRGHLGYGVTKAGDATAGMALAQGLESIEAARAWVDRKIEAGLAP